MNEAATTLTRAALEAVKLGRLGIAKQIFLGFRQTNAELDYLKACVTSAHSIKA